MSAVDPEAGRRWGMGELGTCGVVGHGGVDSSSKPEPSGSYIMLFYSTWDSESEMDDVILRSAVCGGCRYLTGSVFVICYCRTLAVKYKNKFFK